MSLYSVKVSLKLRAGVAQRPIFAFFFNFAKIIVPYRICRMAGRAGTLFGKRKAGRSRWGTPCHTYTAFFESYASFGAHHFTVQAPIMQDLRCCQNAEELKKYHILSHGLYRNKCN